VSKCYSQFTVSTTFYVILVLISLPGILCCSD
jgi:hypothetical protein